MTRKKLKQVAFMVWLIVLSFLEFLALHSLPLVPVVNRGDLIGCILKFEMESNGKVPVVFCLNGNQVSDEEVLIEYDKTAKQLYPYVGMGQHGVQVLAKVRTSV